MPPMPVLSKRWEYVENIFAFRIWKDSRRHFSHLLVGQEAFRWMSHQSLAHQSGSKGWTNVNKLNNKFIAIHCRWTRFDSFCRSQHNTAMPPFLPDFWPSFAFSKGTVAFGCCDFQMRQISLCLEFQGLETRWPLHREAHAIGPIPGGSCRFTMEARRTRCLHSLDEHERIKEWNGKLKDNLDVSTGKTEATVN